VSRTEPDGGDLISSSSLASNQPNTFSVLNVKISIEQQQRNILNIPLIILRKKKKTARILSSSF